MLKVAEINGNIIELNVKEQTLYCNGAVVLESEGCVHLSDYDNAIRNTFKGDIRFEEIQFSEVTDKMIEMISEGVKIDVSQIENIKDCIAELELCGYEAYLDSSTDYIIAK